MKKLWGIFFIIFTTTHLFTEIITEKMTYQIEENQYQGFFAYDNASSDKRPGVLVVHEWWGHNEYAQKRAIKLAELGYVAFALDMYGEGKNALHPDEAGQFAQEVFSNINNAQLRFQKAYSILQNHPLTQSNHIAAIGYCFGGRIVLHMARIGMDLDAVISFHGSLKPFQTAQKDKVKSKILVCHGEDDVLVSKETIQSFHQEMENAEVEFEFISYPGVKHSFTNPLADELAQKFNLPLAYNKEADQSSWESMKSFLEYAFQST